MASRTEQDIFDVLGLRWRWVAELVQADKPCCGAALLMLDIRIIVARDKNESAHEEND